MEGSTGGGLASKLECLLAGLSHGITELQLPASFGALEAACPPCVSSTMSCFIKGGEDDCKETSSCVLTTLSWEEHLSALP